MSNFIQEAASPQVGRTISLSEKARATLGMITSAESGINLEIPLFASDTEAVRFACMLGLRVNGDTLVPIANEANARTLINIGSLDTDGAVSFTQVVSLLAPTAIQEEPLTRVVRRYAEWGLARIQEWREQADIAEEEVVLDMAHLIEKSEALIDETGVTQMQGA